jgi:hypothetical protein
MRFHVCTIGYSDYDVFLESDKGSLIQVKKVILGNFRKHPFQNFEPFLANWALKFKQNVNMT